ncbi:hypothetical protein [Cytobacillus firmus]|uniref:hypothetical protein n=2 Tax=Cytobacillus TaxID=2675230 RepID=UPI00203E580A|nr:hypothetical protein [Cytobacillus firmus]
MNFSTSPVTDGVIVILDTAIDCMNRYNQVFVNEGHLLKGLLNDATIATVLSEEMKNTILTLGTSPRDLITHLGSYTFPQMNTPLSGKFIMMVMKSSLQPLRRKIFLRSGLIRFAGDFRRRRHQFISQVRKTLG